MVLSLTLASRSARSSLPPTFLLPFTSPSSSSSFHTSSPALETRRKLVARQKKARNLALRASRDADPEKTLIDPVLGDLKPTALAGSRGSGSGFGGRRMGAAGAGAQEPAKARRSKWEDSVLKKVLIEKNSIWYPETERPSITKTDLSASSDSDSFPLAQSFQPQHLNAALANPVDRDFILRALPEASVEFFAAPNLSTDSALAAAEAALLQESQKSETLLKILDLRNSDSRGIRVVNTQRIISVFAPTGASSSSSTSSPKPDTGSPPVVAAILTMRIRALAEHLAANPRDVHNKRSLRGLVMKRKGVLEYYRKKTVAKYGGDGVYLELLSKLGLDRRAVEGEVVVR